MGDLRNEFSWSWSRHTRFGDCRRAYYWNHSGSWGGWYREAEGEARLAYLLKQITGLAAWGGSVVHDVVETALHDLKWGRLVTVEALQKRARELMVRQWRESRSKEWEFDPKHRSNLFEHYYGDTSVDRRSVQMRDKIHRCLENFRRSGTYEELQAVPKRNWVAVEELERFPVDGVPVWVKIDCAYRREGSGQLVIVDWKTGKRSDMHRRQLECYALHAVRTMEGVNAEDIVLRPVYLDDGTETDLVVSQDDLEGLEALIRESMDAMRAPLVDLDGNVARLEDFPMVDDSSSCRWCNFRELCGFGPLEG